MPRTPPSRDLAVFFRQGEIDNRRWQRAIEQQHLPIHAFGADQMHAHMSGGKAAKDAQCSAAQRMAQLQGFDLLQAIAEADEPDLGRRYRHGQSEASRIRLSPSVSSTTASTLELESRGRPRCSRARSDKVKSERTSVIQSPLRPRK